VFNFGVMVGAIIFTSLADRLGRKPIHLACQYSVFAVGLVIAFAPNYVAFVVLRFIQGAVRAVTNYSSLRETRRRATEHHLPYGITQCYLPPDTDGRANIEQLEHTLCTCILHAFAGCLLDHVNGVLIKFVVLLITCSACLRLATDFSFGEKLSINTIKIF